MSKFAVIIPAAGQSSRFGDSRRKKPFIELKGRPVWVRALEVFANRDDVAQTLIVVSPEDMEFFKEKFQDPNRYRLGRVGRFRINKKFNQDVPENEMTLTALDYLNAIRYLLRLRNNEGHVDDIDHLGNRLSAPLTNWPRMNCARASSNCAGPCRSA